MTVLAEQNVERAKQRPTRLSVMAGDAANDGPAGVPPARQEAARTLDPVVTTMTATGKSLTPRRLLADEIVPGIRLRASTADLDTPVHRVVIWDPACPIPLDQGDLVLAVGVGTAPASLGELLLRAGIAHAAAVVVRGDTDDGWMRHEAARTGTTVLGVADDVPWDTVDTQVRAALSNGGGTAWAGRRYDDLYALADAGAADLGGPVEIDDDTLCVLAFSNLDHPLDELRTRSILDRRPPGWAMEWLHDSGLIQRIRETYRPLRLAPPGSAPRWVMPVRIGVEILGYVWVTEPATGVLDTESPTRDADAAGPGAADGMGSARGQVDGDVMVRLAREAADLLFSERSRPSREHRVRTGLLRGVLDGTSPPEMLAGLLDTPDQLRLIGLEIAQRGTGTAATERRCLADLAMLRAEATGLNCVATSAGDRVYVLAESSGTGPATARALAADIIERASNQLGLRVVAAVGEEVSEPASLPGARRTVDCVLALTPAGHGSQIAIAEELRPHVVLSELQHLVRDRPDLLHGRLSVLDELDRTQNTEYVATLRAYFDASCDRARAAQALFVHRNTLRYRLQRIRELCGLDLDDPVERLVAELQLRLATADRAATG